MTFNRKEWRDMCEKWRERTRDGRWRQETPEKTNQWKLIVEKAELEKQTFCVGQIRGLVKKKISNSE